MTNKARNLVVFFVLGCLTISTIVAANNFQKTKQSLEQEVTTQLPGK